jgi:hypothetical protein
MILSRDLAINREGKIGQPTVTRRVLRYKNNFYLFQTKG